MTRYETLFLATPEITGDEVTKLEQHVDTIVKKAAGSLISYERWGKYRLAYPVKKNDYGVYILARFEIEDINKKAALDEIKTLCDIKYPNLVMRFMTTKLNPKASLAYQKPESLEDIPTHDVDTFLRENKMESLRTSIPSEGEKAAASTNDQEAPKAAESVESDEAGEA